MRQSEQRVAGATGWKSWDKLLPQSLNLKTPYLFSPPLLGAIHSGRPQQVMLRLLLEFQCNGGVRNLTSEADWLKGTT